MRARFGYGAALIGLALTFVFTGCQPGYIKASQLESRGQGPAACAKSCEDLGMRMAALVLVGDSLPGCVCQPVNLRGAPLETGERAPQSSLSEEGAAASTTGYVVLAAAAAAREQQRQQQLQQGTKKY